MKRCKMQPSAVVLLDSNAIRSYDLRGYLQRFGENDDPLEWQQRFRFSLWPSRRLCSRILARFDFESVQLVDRRAACCVFRDTPLPSPRVSRVIIQKTESLFSLPMGWTTTADCSSAAQCGHRQRSPNTLSSRLPARP